MLVDGRASAAALTNVDIRHSGYHHSAFMVREQGSATVTACTADGYGPRTWVNEGGTLRVNGVDVPAPEPF